MGERASLICQLQAGKGKTAIPELDDPFGELAAVQSEWIVADELDLKVQKTDNTTRKGSSVDFQTGDFVEAEVRIDIQITTGRDGQKQAKPRFFMTRVVRLSEKKHAPNQKVGWKFRQRKDTS